MTTITVPRAVLEQALEALEATHYDIGSAERQRLEAMDAITALRAALAQQAEPVQVAERERVASQWDGCVTHQLDTFGPVDIGASIRAGELVEAQQAEMADEYRKGFIAGQIDMRDREEKQDEPVEPVAWMLTDDSGMRFVSVDRPHPDFVPLYTHPPRREWQLLSEEEIEDMSLSGTNSELRSRQFARAVEAALKEKNQ